MGFRYRQVMGEIIYPCFKARPEISPAAIKLSQYMDNPARIHYQAIRKIIDYLAATIDEGIYYWRQSPIDDLPEGPLPRCHSDNHEIPTEFFTDNDGDFIYAFADSDWGSVKSIANPLQVSLSCLQMASPVTRQNIRTPLRIRQLRPNLLPHVIQLNWFYFSDQSLRI